MIEGLRVAPAYLDARADGNVPKSCEECRKQTNVTTRQHMACGYEKALDVDPSTLTGLWSPTYMRTTICPGYTVGLPATQEVLGAYVQWEQRTLTEYLGAPPTEVALDCLKWLRAGINEHAAAEMKRKHPKGGA